EDVRNVEIIVLLDEPEPVHEPREAADGERAPAESEEVDLVAGHVVVHDEAVEVADVAPDPVTERAAQEMVHEPLRADPVVVEDDLIRPVASPRQDGPCDLGDVGRAPSPRARIGLVGIAPGAVRTDHDSLHLSPGAAGVQEARSARVRAQGSVWGGPSVFGTRARGLQSGRGRARQVTEERSAAPWSTSYTIGIGRETSRITASNRVGRPQCRSPAGDPEAPH